MSTAFRWAFKPPRKIHWRTNDGRALYNVDFVATYLGGYEVLATVVALTKPTAELRALVAEPCTQEQLLAACRAKDGEAA